jgi:putative transposase
MLKNYKFRIYPTKKQEIILNDNLDFCKFVYNKQLGLKIKSYKESNISLSKFDLDNCLIKLKQEFLELNNVHSQVLQDINKRINFAFSNFFRRVKSKENPGFPRFKSKSKYNSLTYPQSGFKLENKLYLSKIGKVAIVKHRNIKGRIKTLTIKKSSSNKWFVYFAVEKELERSRIKNNNLIGIDLGLNNFYTDSEGNLIDNPKCLRKSEERLKLLHRKLSKKMKGSKNRIKIRNKLSKLYEKITNQRNDFLHKESRKLVDNYSNIAVEDLKVKNMVKNHYLAKSINDASWSKFIKLLSYKVEETGGKLIKVNPRNTSQLCICGNKVEKSLAIRTHKCNSCGIQINRDIMSAMIIKERAFGTVGSTGNNAWGNVLIETSVNQESQKINN